METALSPLEFMGRSRRLFSQREAVVDGDLRLTYGQFFGRCDRFSAALQTLGVRQGDRVATIAPNIHQHLEQYYAVPQIGAVLVPVNYRLVADDFRYIIEHSGATVVCVHSDYRAAVDEIRDDLSAVQHFVVLDGDAPAGWLAYEALIEGASDSFDRPAIAESDLLTINYTSGTTSRPKGVMITHRNAYMNSVGTLVHVHMSPADRYLWTLPMFHANGWTFVWTVTAAGATHVCLPRIDAKLIFTLVRDEHVTMLCAAPTILVTLANAPADLRRGVPTGVRVLTAGAAPAAATIERIEGDLGWEITHVYGLTETSPFITICQPLPEHKDAVTVAERARIKARQGVELLTSGELRVVDDDGSDVPHDGQTQGEIVVRGNVVMRGYYNDPEESAKALRDGWFHSGDAAIVHSDGYVEVCDRIKDVIISGGENISSIEVEGVMMRHPSVLEIAVVGMPHERWGEAPHAFVVLREGTIATEDELRAFAREHMAHFKTPHTFRFVDELPKTATGKVQKFVLRGKRSAVTTQ